MSGVLNEGRGGLLMLPSYILRKSPFKWSMCELVVSLHKAVVAQEFASQNPTTIRLETHKAHHHGAP